MGKKSTYNVFEDVLIFCRGKKKISQTQLEKNINHYRITIRKTMIVLVKSQMFREVKKGQQIYYERI